MRWMEISVEAHGAADELCGTLEALGVGGMVVEDEREFLSFLEGNRQYWDFVDEELLARYKGLSRVKFYLSDDEAGWALLNTIRAALDLPLDVKSVADSDWENNWREYYRPIEIGKKLLIVPEWLDAGDTKRLVLRLDPGLSFGTGEHASTQLCLAMLEEYVRPGARVLDLGCGSGILGIGAILLGARSVTGCDIDPLAPEAAMRNAALNGIGAGRFSAIRGDVIKDAALRTAMGGCYDLVLANIVADVIIPLAGLVREFLSPDGIFICSGIIESRRSDVERALRDAGLRTVARREKDEWNCFACVM